MFQYKKALVVTILALALTSVLAACDHGSSRTPAGPRTDPSPSLGIAATTTTASQATAPPTASPSRVSTPTNPCAAIDNLDPMPLLGKTRHRPCSSDPSLGTLGTSVWTRESDGVRVSVSVVSNREAEAGVKANGAGYASFQQLYDQAKAGQRCTISTASGLTPRRCVDQTSNPEEPFIIDMDDTYLMVWMSHEGEPATRSLVTNKDAFMSFVNKACTTIYRGA